MSVRQAVALFESFRERRPTKLTTMRVSVPKAVACMGHVEALDYRTTHAGKAALYTHKFAKGSRPLLCVSADGRQLLLIGGNFKWDERGIVDKTPHGRDIIPKNHARNPRQNYFCVVTRPAGRQKETVCDTAAEAWNLAKGSPRGVVELLANDGWLMASLHYSPAHPLPGGVERMENELHAKAKRHERNPKTAGRWTLKEAMATVRNYGFTLVKRDGEYIVKPAGQNIDHPHSYFTNDLEDAVGTARLMAEERRKRRT